MASSAVMLWALTSPLGALMFSGVRAAWGWFGAYLALAVVSGLIDGSLTNHAADIPTGIRITFFVLNVGGVSLTAYVLLQYFVREREKAQQASERLLLNVLPAPIAERLKEDGGVIADAFDDVTVLFADIAEFTPMSEAMAPKEVVQLLNELFSAFDRLTERYRLEKIKTIGDAYMVAGGLPIPRLDHAEAVAEMAICMRDEVAERTGTTGSPLAVRIGIDTGPAVAGVIGERKFIYDLWGDTVNTASRMESHGVAGATQVTARTYQRLCDRYAFEERGPIAVKGKGEMMTYLLLGSKTTNGTRSEGG